MFFLARKKMAPDPVFREKFELKREYKELLKLLPKLNECDACTKHKCKNCKYFSAFCFNCRNEKC